MSVMLRPRPVASPWEALSADAMIKAALDLKQVFGAVKNFATKPVPLTSGAELGLGKGLPVWGAGAIGGGLGLASGHSYYRAATQKANEAATRAAATTAAAKQQAEAATQLATPDAIQGSLGGVRDWAVRNSPWLAPAAIGLGGLGMYMKNRADRKREEEERELLEGIQPKEASAIDALAREFPVQVGFLARCGARGLSGTEVRAAVEKCASISDDIAEDWIRFFAGATGLEAGAASEMIKAAAPPTSPMFSGVMPRPAPAPVPAPAIPPAPAPATPPAPAPAPPRVDATGAPLPTVAQLKAQQQTQNKWQQQYGTGAAMDNFLSRQRMVHTYSPDERAQNLAAEQARVQRGMDPREAAKQNPTSDINKPTWGSAGWGLLRGASKAMGALAGTPVAFGSDVVNAVRGQPGGWLPNTAAAARDFVSPLTEPMLPRFEQARQQANRGFFQDVTPGWAKSMHNYAGDPNQGNMATRAAAGVGGTLTDWAEPIAGAVTLGGLPTSGMKGLAYGASKIPGLARFAPAIEAAGGVGSILPQAGRLGAVRGGAQLASNMALGPASLGFTGAMHGMGQLSGTATAGHQQQQVANVLSGAEPWDPQKVPPPQNLDDFGGYADSIYQSQRNHENAQRIEKNMPPMTAQEEQNFKAEKMAPMEAWHTQQQDKRAASVLGLADAKGAPNPNGQINTTGMDPKNVRAWMEDPKAPGRPQALQHVTRQAEAQFGKLTQALPPDVTERLSRPGAQLTPQDTAALKQAGVDPAQIAQTTQRYGTAAALTAAYQSGGDFDQMKAKMQAPQTMAGAAQNNPSLNQEAQQQVQSGAAPDFMTGLKQTWDGLGTMGQVLATSGLALGAIGLMNTFMGEGGLGSILMTLMGGAGLGLAANKAGLLPQGVSNVINPMLQGASGYINPILQQLGLGGLMGGQGGASAQGAPAPAATPPGQAAPAPPAPAAPAQTAGAQPAASAAAQLGINIKDPAARAKLLSSPPAQQDAALRQAMAADPNLAGQLQSAASHWGGWFQGAVESKMREALGPNTSTQEMQAIIDAFKRTQTAA